MVSVCASYESGAAAWNIKHNIGSRVRSADTKCKLTMRENRFGSNTATNATWTFHSRTRSWPSQIVSRRVHGRADAQWSLGCLSGSCCDSVLRFHLVLFPAAQFLSNKKIRVVTAIVRITPNESGLINLLPHPSLPFFDWRSAVGAFCAVDHRFITSCLVMRCRHEYPRRRIEVKLLSRFSDKGGRAGNIQASKSPARKRFMSVE
jgi:hypothetical protein